MEKVFSSHILARASKNEGILDLNDLSEIQDFIHVILEADDVSPNYVLIRASKNEGLYDHHAIYVKVSGVP